MPDMTPVGAMVQPPPQSNPLGVYSEILGIRQQQQALVGQAAEVSQEQQKNQEFQQAQQVLASVKTGAYRNQDGSLNRVKLSDDLNAIGPYATGQASTLLSQANEYVQNKSALENLTLTEKKEIGGALGSLAANPNLSPTEIIDTMEQLRQQHPNDPAFSRLLTSVGIGIPPGNSQQLRQTMARLSAAATGEPQTAPASIDTGATIQPGGASQFGLGFTPSGAPIPKQLPPQIVTPPGGIPIAVGGGARGPISGPNTTGGVIPTSQDYENFGAYQSNLNNRVNVATDAIPRIQEVEKALQAMRSGAGSSVYADIARRLQALGVPQSVVDAVGNGNLAATQEAEKYMFQTTFAGLRQAMQGDPARVAEFQSAEQVFPNIGTDPRAAHQVLGFMQDQAKRDYAEQQALNQARKAGTFNPATWQADYQQQLRAGKIPGVPGSQIPNSGPQEGQTGRSKSGKPIVYRNGRWEYQ